MREQARVWFPDGRAHVVPLRAEPRRGHELIALGVRKGAWIVEDMRANGNRDTPYDVWVQSARRLASA
jgi:hypothetical protein